MTYNKIYRVVMFLLLQLNWLLFGRFWKVDVLFLVYPGTPADSKAYGPDWLLRGYLPLVFPIGWIIQGKRRVGLVMACPITTGKFEGDAALLQQVMDRLQKIAQQLGVKAGAFAGRVSSIAARHELPIEPPFVHGTMGTLFAIVETISALASKHSLSIPNTTIAVAGVGYTGRRLIDVLAVMGFKAVIGHDPVNREESFKHAPAHVTFSTNPAVLEPADIVVALTAQGDQVEELIPHLRTGTFLADDTHPPVSSDIRRKLGEQGVTVYKVAAGQYGGTHIHPKLPGFKDYDIPGCLVEALAVASNDGVVVTDYTHFAEVARAIGLHALLVDYHPEG